ncbi:MAG: hypothetical protein UZ22_OP11002000237 [Microgenomates bacterium OLB23]|nr:MAG: hypothetical protein UZ22_OP11002000237 [Microgenomates bacterium OLB23]
MRCEKCGKKLNRKNFLYFKPTEQAVCRPCHDTLKYRAETDGTDIEEEKGFMDLYESFVRSIVQERRTGA